MKDLNLMSIINGYRAVIENIPDEECYDYPDDTNDYYYDDILNTVWDGVQQLIPALLKTEAFVLVHNGEFDFVRIYNTVKERDTFVDRFNKEHPENLTAKFLERIDAGKPACHAIEFNEFIEYAQGGEVVLSYYRYDPVDKAIDFNRLGLLADDNEG